MLQTNKISDRSLAKSVAFYRRSKKNPAQSVAMLMLYPAFVLYENT